MEMKAFVFFNFMKKRQNLTKATCERGLAVAFEVKS